MASQADRQLKGELLECPVCIQKCVHPVKLPCGHVFCYLCMKGIALRAKKCAMCRRPIPPNFLHEPELIDKADLDDVSDDVKWFYQGRTSGWWQYEHRMENDIEKRYQENDKDVFDIQIAGYLYTIDFENMEQYRKEDHSISRAIKRDYIKHVAGIKGKAGIQLNTSDTLDSQSRTIEGSLTSNNSVSISTTGAVSQQPASTNATPLRSSSHREASQRIPTVRAQRLSMNQSGGNDLSQRHRTGGRVVTGHSSQPVDLTRLVAEMNLGDGQNSSSDESDEPATAV